jgi:hypothetical protein
MNDDYSLGALLRDPERYERMRKQRAALQDAAPFLAKAIKAHLAMVDGVDPMTPGSVQAVTLMMRTALAMTGQ